MVSVKWNIRNSAEDCRGREGKIRQKQRGRQTNEGFLSTGNKLRVAGGEVGGGWGNWVMGIEGT